MLSVLLSLRLLAVFGCLSAVSVHAAGPSGGTVSAGAATITQSAAQTTIKQTSDKAVVNWSNFSIGSGSTVRFVQPSASSIALNRVTGTQASVIQGALQANGQVWVLNPNGVLIAPGGQVAVSSFLATTRSLTDQQFMAGNYAFADGGVAGSSVINQGSIIVAEGGYAVLAGEAVRNEGLIEANLGQVVLGGAKAFTIDLSGDNTLAFVVTAPVDVTPTDGKAVVDNSGSIQAAGGRVLMTARAASQVVGQVINTGGVVAATSAQMVNGKIVLEGGTGSVSVAGNLNASGKGAGQTGGSIEINAQKIQVKANAKLDVSGDAGGGKIAIGGGGPNTRTQSFTPAESTTIAAGARLEASALTRGDGGDILVFTSLTNPLAFTQVAGSLIARGGAQGGNGGFIETSGYRLDVNGITVSTSAPKGRLGLWLLDPTAIEIGDFDSSGGCTATAITDTCTKLNNEQLSIALGVGGAPGTDILVSATASILVSGEISWSSSSKLTLSAIGPDGSGTITVNALIRNTGTPGGWLKLNAKTIAINGDGQLRLSKGDVEVNQSGAVAGSSFTLDGGDEGHRANNIRIQAATVAILNSVTADSAFSITNASSVRIAASVQATTISVLAPGGDINIAAGLTSPTSTLSAANVTFAETATAGALNVTATTAITLDSNYSAGDTVFTAPIVNWNAGWFGASTELRTNRVNWGAAGAFTGAAGAVVTVGVPTTAGTTTFNMAGDLSLRAWRIDINNPLTWSTHQLSLLGNQAFGLADGLGVSVGASLTGTSGAKLVIANAFAAGGGSQTISLFGTPANQSIFTLGAGVPQTADTVDYPVGVSIKKVVIDNSGAGPGGGGGGGGGGGSGSSDTPVVVVTPTTTTTSTTAATAAAKAAAEAAAAKAIADAAAVKAATLDTTMKVVVEQAITQAVATVVASTSAAVFVAPAPPPPATSTTSSASATTSTDTAASSSASTASTTSTTTTTTTSTTTTVGTANTGAPSAGQSTTVTQEFVEPLTVATLSSTASSVNDPGDASAATTSATSGPASQTAIPASTAAAAPASPSLTPVAISKDGADAGDFTLQTVKPPAPATTAKQEVRPTERVTTTPVSPGIALQSTQKTPVPSGSVLGREISGSGNNLNW